MATFELHVGKLIEKEGGFRLTDDPSDSGGQTYAGISRRANPNWKGWEYVDRGEAPPVKLVHGLYRQSYWTPIMGDDIKDEEVAEAMLSCAVLSGVGTVTKLSQRVTGAKIDGRMGPRTMAKINEMDPHLFETLLALFRVDRFRQIANRRKKDRKYLRGWLNRLFEEFGAD